MNERPAEMAELGRTLLPQRQSCRLKVFVLHGLEGRGKTQLTVEFVRLHHRRFSSVFWLDGRSEDSLKRSAVSCASRIPDGQISEISRIYSVGGNGDLDVVVKEVMTWLAQLDNTDWLLIFDNVDREYNPRDRDPDALQCEALPFWRRPWGCSDSNQTGQVRAAGRLAAVGQG